MGISLKLFEQESWNFDSYLVSSKATDTVSFVYILAAVIFFDSVSTKLRRLAISKRIPPPWRVPARNCEPAETPWHLLFPSWRSRWRCWTALWLRAGYSRRVVERRTNSLHSPDSCPWGRLGDSIWYRRCRPRTASFPDIRLSVFEGHWPGMQKL